MGAIRENRHRGGAGNGRRCRRLTVQTVAWGGWLRSRWLGGVGGGVGLAGGVRDVCGGESRVGGGESRVGFGGGVGSVAVAVLWAAAWGVAGIGVHRLDGAVCCRLGDDE